MFERVFKSWDGFGLGRVPALRLHLRAVNAVVHARYLRFLTPASFIVPYLRFTTPLAPVSCAGFLLYVLMPAASVGPWE